MRTLQSYALVLITEGAGRYWAHDREQPREVTAPGMIWIFPGVAHRYGPTDIGWTEHWMLFDGLSAQAYESYGCWNRSSPVASLTTFDFDVGAVFGELRSALGRETRQGELDAAGIVHRLIALSSGPAIDASATDASESIIEDLREHATEPLSVADHAHRLSIDVATLRHAVRAGTGMSPLEFVLQVRTSRALSLLADTDLPVGSISELVGYTDPAYFSRFFTNRVGMPPSEVRLQHRREQG